MARTRSRVLFVCEGNICRSPLGALCLDAFLDASSDVRVESAGLRAVVGSGMDGAAAAQALRLGLDPSRHVARLLTQEMVDSAAVVLTMTAEQRTRVVQLNPIAMRRTFTLKEFAIVAQLPITPSASDLSTLVELAKKGDQTRSTHQNHDLDIDDPYRRDEAVHFRVAEEIRNACTAVARRTGK